MGVRSQQREELERLKAKTLEAQLVSELRAGLGCSPFEANAVIQTVHEVYAPRFNPADATSGPPGVMWVVAVDADEPAGKPIKDCRKRTVQLCIHRGHEDDILLRKQGPQAFRIARIPDVLQQAMSRGALLTREDLAYRVFFVSTRTISRDLAMIRKAQPDAPLPLRGTVHDLGPVLTHREQIVRLALKGRTMTQICTATHHSAGAVANYVSTFTRCAQLQQQEMLPAQIAFLLQRGEGLVKKYLAILRECDADPGMKWHLDELCRMGRVGSGGKKGARRLTRKGVTP